MLPNSPPHLRVSFQASRKCALFPHPYVTFTEPMEQDNIITIYADGSYKDGVGGLGIVICQGGTVTIQSVHRGVVRAPEGAEVQLVLDNLRVFKFLIGGTVPSEDEAILTSELAGPRKLANRKRVNFGCFKIAAHGAGELGYDNRDFWMNGVTDCLAHLGRVGRTILTALPDDADFSDALKATDWRLDPRRRRSVEERSRATRLQRRSASKSA